LPEKRVAVIIGHGARRTARTDRYLYGYEEAETRAASLPAATSGCEQISW
jgi:hypothetical protein